MDAVTPRLAIVSGGVVIQIAEAYPPGWRPPEGEAIACGPEPQIGWAYDGKAFIAPPPPPRTVHSAWLKAALAASGKLAVVNAAVATIGGVTEVLWEYGTNVREDDPDVARIGSALGVNVKTLFDAAEAIRDVRGL